MSYPRGAVQQALGLPKTTLIREMHTEWKFELLAEDCEGATPYIAKFSVPKAARRALQTFDRTGKFESGAYHLAPLYASKQRAVRKEERQFVAWRKAVGGVPNPKAPLKSKPHYRLLEVK